LKQVNIGTEENSKIANIGDYWEPAQQAEIVALLKEYQDVFAKDFWDMKGIVEELGVMRIPLKPEAQPIKKRPYRLNLKYKERVKQQLDQLM